MKTIKYYFSVSKTEVSQNFVLIQILKLMVKICGIVKCAKFLIFIASEARL